MRSNLVSPMVQITKLIWVDLKNEGMVYYGCVEKRPYLHIGGRSNSVKIKYGGYCLWQILNMQKF